MNEILPPSPNADNRLQRLWQTITQPHPSLEDLKEQQYARLAISLVFVILLLNLSGFIASSLVNGLAEGLGGFGAPALGLLISYALTKTRNYRTGVFFFALIFGMSAYINIIRQGAAADISTNIFIFVPLSLIMASNFLSGWAVFLLVGLNIGAFVSLPLFGIPLPANAGGMAGILTTIGVTLMFLDNFKNKSESIRLAEIRKINRQLEELKGGLEQRVTERTAELDEANRHLQRRAAQLQTITQLSEAIAHYQDLTELFSAVTRLISEQFGFYHVGIFLLDNEKRFVVLQAANSEGGQRMLARAHMLEVGTGVVGYAAQTGQPRIALDVGADAVFFNNPDLPQTRSEAALPLKSRDEVIGVLDVQSTAAGAFSEEDLQVLTTLANQVAIAFENTRLLEETRAALNQMQEVYNEFTRTEWHRTVSLAEQAGFRYNAGRIEILEKELRTPEVVSAAAKGQPALRQAEGSEEKRPAVAVPVKLRGEVVGVLHIESNDPSKKWQEDDIRLLEAVAERAAFAMENARLFQDARRRAAKEQVISEASAKIGSALNLENILQTTAEELGRVLGGAEVLIQFQNKEADQ
ncbi:MAG: GAF domain-containing protein [Chloroflexota bacterium]